jgi:ParB family chromosome partitioning protein
VATRLNRYIDSVSAFDNIEIGLISFSSNPIRDPEGDVTELMDSIREHGLLEPIIVRPKGRAFEVIAGNRRLRACRLLRHRRVKCIVTNLGDAECYEASLVENVQRRTLEPLEEALAFRKYCEKYGWGGQTELARKIGKSQEYVSHRMKLLDLPGPAKDALRAGKISPSGAQELVWIDDDESRSAALKLLSAEGCNTKEVRRVSRGGGPREAGMSLVSGPIPSESHEGRGAKLISESILILRISLVRLDGIIVKATDQKLKKALLNKRRVLHKLVDDLIQMKNAAAVQLRR